MSSNTCPEHRGNFPSRIPTLKVQPLFHVPLIPLHKSLYLPSAGPFFLLHRLELDNHTQRLIPSKQSPKKKETNQTCLPACLFDPQSPTTPLPCRNFPRLCLSPSIYLSIHPIHHLSRITRYSSLANQQQHLNHHHHHPHPQQINNNLPIHYYPRIIQFNNALLPSR